MTDQFNDNTPLVFGLDIGTRSVVGIVGYKEKEKFHIVGHHMIEHDTRAMIDGQIHDINKVAETVNLVKEALEKQINRPLTSVCIAAAGRVLKTGNVKVESEFEVETPLNKEHIFSLELQGVEQAHRQVISTDDNDITYHCVGYSIVKYYLNDFIMTSLDGHKGKKIGAEVLATFLPQEVIDSLYSVIEKVGLKVSSLTLEPIAAINVAIPENYRLLNLALVDVGAGTSDIAITKDGSIIAYGMIPYAGDEITEQIVHHYLVDFETAEKIKLKLDKSKVISFKDIMGTSHKYEPSEIIKTIMPAIENMAENISSKIYELNGNKPTNAVFCVGGGGQISSFTDLLSQKLNLTKERVALRGSEVLQFVNILKKGVKKDPSIVTPVGIALSAYYQNSNFIHVFVNDTLVKIYNNNKLTVIDVAVLTGFNYKDLFPKRGESLTFTLNGEEQVIKGMLGESAKIVLNNEEVSINTPIVHNDQIQLIEATSGEPPTVKVEELKAFKGDLHFIINNQNISCPPIIKANGEHITKEYIINNNDRIEIKNNYTVGDLLEFMDLTIEIDRIILNGEKVNEDSIIENNDYVNWKEKKPSMEIEELLNNKEIAFQEAVVTVDEIGSSEMSDRILSSIIVKVNNEEIKLLNKSEYIFVDIFDYIDFDLRKPKGKLITKLNNNDVTYTQALKSGDKIEIYWEG
ncbi:cell division protein FtsA [Natranaerovirga pectinivora]|uniref:Cell division protein FtsA n=1 Tax=Natranaerovirga pectinivora TaxID=682400 RepID=A0A4R3MQN9_9FIRM|nr:pilus assembly protein PilM [Natranaerovirga pectinivora]TCT17104.1 cell division protein FtsA [Natranaerovirga pectinivora]